MLEPLLSISGQSICELNNEIVSVYELLVEYASLYLPSYSPNSGRKSQFRDGTLRSLCRASKSAWRQWHSNGRPQSGSIYDNMHATKKSVRDRVIKLRASITRKEIEQIDRCFKSNDRRCFRIKDHSHTIPIRIRSSSGEVISDQQAVSEEFVRFFSDLSTSTINKKVSCNRISTAHERSYYPAAIDPLSDKFSTAEMSNH